MSTAISSPVTGGAQTGLTSPTYTITADTPPAGTRGRQYAVTALGGTQTGVEANRVGQPFTITYLAPLSPKGAPAVSQTTGAPVNVPRNTHKLICRKGVEVVSGYYSNVVATITIDIPAGAEINDPESIRACMSMLIGSVWQISSGFGDSMIDGIP